MNELTVLLTINKNKMKKLLQNKAVIYITLAIGLPIYFIGMFKDIDLLLPLGFFSAFQPYSNSLE